MSLGIRQASLDPACQLLITLVGKFLYLTNSHMKWDHNSLPYRFGLSKECRFLCMQGPRKQLETKLDKEHMKNCDEGSSISEICRYKNSDLVL